MSTAPTQPSTATNTRLLWLLFWVISVFPCLNTTLLYLTAFYVRHGFGRWPVAYKDGVNMPIVMDVLPWIKTGHELCVTALPLVWAGLFIFVVVSKQRRNITPPTIFFITGITAIWLLGRFDPWGFQNWMNH